MSPERVACPLGPIFYLPHFANRAGKRRIVFDATAKSRGLSLNCHLLRGPKDLQPRPLIHILMHFRQSRIGVREDIQEMFHRVRIIDKDQDALRFVWRDSEADPLLPPDVYAMDAMILGARCSPCSSQHVKNLNVLRFAGEHPRAVEAIVKYHYVDDFVDTFKDEGEAAAICQEVVNIHREGGFELRGFVSNSSQLISILKSQRVEVDSELLPDQNKVLGMYWDHKEDVFCFKLDMPRVEVFSQRIPTRSQAPSLVMSVFYPFGFLANVSVRSRHLMQGLWKSGSTWTDPAAFPEWQGWLEAIIKAATVSIPRCPQPALSSPTSKVQLHNFYGRQLYRLRRRSLLANRALGRCLNSLHPRKEPLRT